MAKVRINSSLVPEDTNVSDDITGPDIIDTPIPPDIQWPQWVNNKWQEYNSDHDPMVIATRQLEDSYYKIQTNK